MVVDVRGRGGDSDEREREGGDSEVVGGAVFIASNGTPTKDMD